MTKPASYPFLALAKRYKIDYGDMLIIAEYWRGSSPNQRQGWRTIERLEKQCGETYVSLLARECQIANREFRDIQSGLIDWNTGEPIYRQEYGRARRPRLAENIEALDYRNAEEE